VLSVTCDLWSTLSTAVPVLEFYVVAHAGVIRLVCRDSCRPRPCCSIGF
jgi:hypothetical protein